MSGWSENTDCPRCGSKDTLERSEDRENVSGECTECGYYYRTIHGVGTLDEVNEQRKYVEMEPLTELAKPLPTWTDEDPLDTVRLTEEIAKALFRMSTGHEPQFDVSLTKFRIMAAKALDIVKTNL